MRSKLIFAVLITFFLIANSFAAKITVEKIDQPHPRLLVNADLMSQIKADIKRGTEPRTSAWKLLKDDLDTKLAANREPAVYNGEEPFLFYRRCSIDSEIARDMAYAYCITGEQKYADFALSYLNSWAGADPMPVTTFDPEDSAANASMLVTRSMVQFVQVYDLLYDLPTFTSTQKKTVEKWFDVAVEEIKRGIKIWEENDYFNYQYFQNHLVSDMLGLVFIGYATGDVELTQFALDSEENERDYMDMLNGIILVEGEEPYFREPGEWPVYNGEIADRYRHFAIAGHSGDYVTKPNRGLQYCHLSLLQMAMAAQIGYSNGLDLFKVKGDNGESLEDSFAFYADFYRLKDSGLKNGFFFGETDRIAIGGDDPGLWELAYMHYPENQEIYDLMVSAPDRPAGSLWLIGRPALLFGKEIKPLKAKEIDEKSEKSPKGNMVVYSPYKVKVPPVTKPHPRLMMDSEDIKLMRERVRSGKQPYADAWKLMKEELDDMMRKNLRPRPYTGDYSLHFFQTATEQSAAARDFAIAYHITGDDKYAGEAIRYLYDWATAKPMPASQFDPEQRYPNSGMEVARASFSFLWAYDLMYNHRALTDSRKAQIEFWFRNLEKVIHEGIKRWDAPHKRGDTEGWVESDNPDDRYFGGQDFQNHITAHVMGLAAIGYTLGDKELVQYAIDSDANPKDFLECIEGIILVEKDKPHDKDVKNVQSGEIIDRYRHYQPPGKGLQYANLTLLTLAVTAEVCYNNGLDFYKYNSPNGERLELPFSFYADFYRTMDASIKGGFYAGETERIGQAGDSPALFELGFNHYPDNPELIDLISSMNRAEQKAWIIGRAVLTHGHSE